MRTALASALLLLGCSSDAPEAEPRCSDVRAKASEPCSQALCCDEGLACVDATCVVPFRAAPELADEEALGLLSRWDRVPVFDGTRLHRMQSSVDRGKGDFGVRLLRNGNKDLNNWICASADASLGKPLVPSTFDLPSCPEPWVKGAVAARFEGSGAMIRFWMTALSWRTASPRGEVLRVYVDDEREPVLQAPIAKVLEGSAPEPFAPPFVAPWPRAFTFRYPVVFAKRLIVTLDGLSEIDNVYHQTTVALDVAPKPRKRAPSPLSREAAKKALASAFVNSDELLANAPRTVPTRGSTILDVAGPATIDELAFEGDRASIARLGVRITWDEATKPAIEASLQELLAMPESGDLATLALVHAGNRHALRLPMPFATRARIELFAAGEGATVSLSARGRKTAPATAARLHSVRSETVAPATGPHPILHLDGRARWVGTCAFLEGHAAPGDDALIEGFNFLEGDEVVSIDGKLAMPGTGTEDYFDSAFYFIDRRHAMPFAAWFDVREDRSTKPWKGRASACRFHLLGDEVDAASKLDVDLEIGNGDPSLLDRYRTIAFVYR